MIFLIFYFQDEDDDVFSTEEKGTNTVDIMQDSFETVELGEDGQFTSESVTHTLFTIQ